MQISKYISNTVSKDTHKAGKKEGSIYVGKQVCK